MFPFPLQPTLATVKCKDVQRIHEDHIHTCCKHPDGHNDITEMCAKQTNFKLPSAKEEAMEDLTVDQVMTGFCWAECVFNQSNFMDANNNLNMTAVRTVFASVHSSDPEYEREMVSAFDHCHSKSKFNIEIYLKLKLNIVSLCLQPRRPLRSSLIYPSFAPSTRTLPANPRPASFSPA